VNDAAAFNRGEDQEQQVTHIGSGEIEVPNEVKNQSDKLEILYPMLSVIIQL
jgi:hypothetical protein